MHDHAESAAPEQSASEDAASSSGQAADASGETAAPVKPAGGRPKRRKSRLDPKDWAALTTTMRPTAELVPSARNARTHPPAQVRQIAESIKRFGWTVSILVDEAGEIIAGHGRVLAANDILHLAEVPVAVLAGLSESEKAAYRVLDNQLTIAGGWDVDLLRVEIDTAGLDGFDSGFMGFRDGELEGLLDPPKGDDASDNGVNGDHKSGGERGELLSLINITVADPRHQCEFGDHFELRCEGQAHDLLCVGVMADWRHWSPLLQGDAVFCPFPGVFVPFSTKAVKHRLVMVQPNVYVAGHILDRWTEVHGSRSVKRLNLRKSEEA